MNFLERLLSTRKGALETDKELTALRWEKTKVQAELVAKSNDLTARIEAREQAIMAETLAGDPDQLRIAREEQETYDRVQDSAAKLLALNYLADEFIRRHGKERIVRGGAEHTMFTALANSHPVVLEMLPDVSVRVREIQENQKLAERQDQQRRKVENESRHERADRERRSEADRVESPAREERFPSVPAPGDDGEGEI